jgi:hypothetical protein
MAEHGITTHPNYTWNPKNGVLDGPPRLYERLREEKDLFPLPGIEAQFLGPHAQSIAITATELSRPDFEQ